MERQDLRRSSGFPEERLAEFVRARDEARRGSVGSPTLRDVASVRLAAAGVSLQEAERLLDGCDWMLSHRSFGGTDIHDEWATRPSVIARTVARIDGLLSGETMDFAMDDERASSSPEVPLSIAPRSSSVTAIPRRLWTWFAR